VLLPTGHRVNWAVRVNPRLANQMVNWAFVQPTPRPPGIRDVGSRPVVSRRCWLIVETAYLITPLVWSCQPIVENANNNVWYNRKKSTYSFMPAKKKIIICPYLNAPLYYITLPCQPQSVRWTKTVGLWGKLTDLDVVRSEAAGVWHAASLDTRIVVGAVEVRVERPVFIAVNTTATKLNTSYSTYSLGYVE